MVPLLLLHGWPGSVREFYELIPMLTKAKDDTVFVVVAPSLPGYGFSEAASVPGLNPTEMAFIFRNLMIRLGYNRFLIQGKLSRLQFELTENFNNLYHTFIRWRLG